MGYDFVQRSACFTQSKMCGIFGILQYNDAVPNASKLHSTLLEMEHRGPDGSGIYADLGIGLAHTRLSLVDPDERSSQPFADRSGRYRLVYNGELYQYQGLIQQLLERHVQLRTTSDTEVLLESLIHLGVQQTLDHLEGMFAFGFYDHERRRLIVARDRQGIKPLLIHQTDSSFMFASNIRAFEPWSSLQPNPNSIAAYMHGFGGSTSGRSFYDNVSIVPPGAMIEISNDGRPTASTWFRMTDLLDTKLANELSRKPAGDLIDRVGDQLQKSVAGQLIADADVGGLCSGGVDSSLVLAMAKKSHPNLAVFHADVVGPLSESDAAKRLADHLKLDFHSVAVTDTDFIDLMPDVIDHYGFPFTFHPNAIPYLKVSRLVQQSGVKAVLCGEGSDECYTGYPWLIPNIRNIIRDVPRNAAKRVAGWIRQTENRMRGKLGSRKISSDDHLLVKGLNSGFEWELGPELYDEDSLIPNQDMANGSNLINDARLSYILRSLLHRNDSLGMAASIEARFPFLDHELMKLAINLPYRTKVRFSPTASNWNHPFLRDKWIIRELAKRYLPKDLSGRKKLGFPTNAYKRIRIEPEYFKGSFATDWFRISKRRLQPFLEAASPALKLRLLHLDLWGRMFIGGVGKPKISQQLKKHVSITPLGHSS